MHLLIGAGFLAASVTSTPAASPAGVDAPANPQTRLEREVGQMIMVGFGGTEPDQAWPKLIRHQIQEGEIGGVLYLSHNVRSQKQIEELNRSILDSASGPPPFIAVDQEGGRVQRLTARIGFPEAPSAHEMARDSRPQWAYQLYHNVACSLRRLKFNVNFGPVVDLLVQPRNPIIARLGRSYSSDPAIVTAFASAFVRAHRDCGIVTALKHFPGHGSSLADSHRALPDISDTWSPTELKPFAALIGRNMADMVMIGHLALGRTDLNSSAEVPATLSHAIVTGLLRQKMGYRGVIVADDMDMHAISDHLDRVDAAIAMFRAGVDMVIISNEHWPDPRVPGEIIAATVREARNDSDLRAHIDAAYRRIVALKTARITGPARTK